MKIKIEIVHGLFGGDSLQVADGSHYSHEKWGEKVLKAVRDQFPDDEADVSFRVDNHAKSSVSVDGGYEDEDTLRHIEEIMQDVWNEVCKDVDNWTPPRSSTGPN